MSDLAGRTALVTGSTHGIGRAVALELANAGARVAIHGRSAKAADELAKLLARQDRHAGTFLADLADPQAVARLAAEVESRLDRKSTRLNSSHSSVSRMPSSA